MTQKTLRDLALALSAANLCLLRVWHALLVKSIYIPTPAGLDYLAAILSTGLLAGVFWLFLAVGGLSTKSPFARWLRWLPFLALLMPLNFLRTLLPDYFSQEALIRNLGKAGFLSLGGGLAVCCAYLIFRWHRALLTVLETIVLCFVPFAGVTLLQAAWFSTDVPAVSPPDKPLAGEVAARQDSGPRILVLIFDEWDYRLTFPERPHGLQLPELDRICSQALVATSAYAPAQRTARAVPALLTGKLVSKTSVEDGRMMITFAGTGKAVDFSAENQVFAEAHRAGLPTAVIGWFFPYCRVLGDTLTKCSWIPHGAASAKLRAGTFRKNTRPAHRDSTLGATAGSHRQVPAYCGGYKTTPVQTRAGIDSDALVDSPSPTNLQPAHRHPEFHSPRKPDGLVPGQSGPGGSHSHRDSANYGKRRHLGWHHNSAHLRPSLAFLCGLRWQNRSAGAFCTQTARPDNRHHLPPAF